MNRNILFQVHNLHFIQLNTNKNQSIVESDYKNTLFIRIRRLLLFNKNRIQSNE